ncbi:hypothetical protein [Roseomonas sp. 18066]|uniref:hypothetical protein n=1 Tax=Roseomonas sp. 18066 TaxID=2681412 RepID=UPI00135AA464|nr:hypothetical protein [Roseomonas sp. 18066]
MAAFSAAAAGPGEIPWHLDLDRMEEDWRLQLLAPVEGPPAISPTGARLLARRLRDAAGANQAALLARAATDRRCPFDLHRLLPIPQTLLRRGPDDVEARAWLRRRWGTLRALRQVRALPAEDRRLTRSGRIELEFFAADWSPWQALRRLRHAWPALIFDLRPVYDDAPP